MKYALIEKSKEGTITTVAAVDCAAIPEDKFPDGISSGHTVDIGKVVFYCENNRVLIALLNLFFDHGIQIVSELSLPKRLLWAIRCRCNKRPGLFSEGEKC